MLEQGSCGVPSCSVTFNNSYSLSLQLPAVRWGDQVLFIACFFEEQHRGFAQDIIWENLKITFLSLSPQSLTIKHLYFIASFLLPFQDSHFAPFQNPMLLTGTPARYLFPQGGVVHLLL